MRNILLDYYSSRFMTYLMITIWCSAQRLYMHLLNFNIGLLFVQGLLVLSVANELMNGQGWNHWSLLLLTASKLVYVFMDRVESEAKRIAKHDLTVLFN
ncbi:hypothetical protein VTH8203_01505 [Vibrio thalassae]|uniref:Uncharacterized protein n=1 Tax=Vibrio thalassae TaxID=1243014 RepID=A0A240EIY1_9VIBR|nr:hypothetical protein [Vibrio thalassae]SNX47890.1 hypothetical protein VTH8203_01505 [Vibrio thalassae]